MILHGLVQIHHLEDRRVEARQQLAGDDHDLQWVLRIAEIVQHLGFLVPGAPPLLVFIGLVVVGIHDDGAGRLAQQPVQLLFIQHATLPVIAHHLAFKAVGVHLGHEVLGDVRAHCLNALRVLHDRSHAHALGGLAALLLRQAHFIGQLGEGLVDGLLIDVQFHRHRLEVQRQRGPVAHGVREGIPAHIAAAILRRAEGQKSILVQLVDGRAGQAEEEGVGQRRAHARTEIALLGTVGFVDHDDNVVPEVQRLLHPLELKYLGDDYLAGVVFQQLRQLRVGLRRHQVGHVRHGEGAEDLSAQVDAVVDDQDRGRIQVLHHAQFLGGKYHQQRLTAALEVPDQALLGVARPHAIHDHVRALILLVAAHHLDLPVALVRGKQCEEPEQVQQHGGSHHGRHAGLHLRQRPLLMGDIRVPRPPQRHRRVQRAIAIALSLGGEVENIGDKHLGDGLFVFLDVLGPVHPADGRPHRGLHLADGHREAVDHQHHVQPLSAGGLRIDPLVGDHEFIVGDIVIVEITDADGLPILAEGEAVLLKHQLFEALILGDQIVRLHGGDQRAQLVYDRVRVGGHLSDAGVQPDQGIPQHRLYQHVRFLARQILCRDIFPATASYGVANHLFHMGFIEIGGHSLVPFQNLVNIIALL